MMFTLKWQAVIAIIYFIVLQQPFGWAEQPTLPKSTEQSAIVRTTPYIETRASKTTKRAARNIVVPADTIIQVKLSKHLSTKGNRLGESVIATLEDPLYIGPFLVAPEGSIIRGKINDINKKTIKKGPNPYIIVDFYELQHPDNEAPLPFQGTLIAYRTGLARKDYVWRIPTHHSKIRANLNNMLEGAAYGLVVNPIFGAPVGAAVGLLKSLAINKVAARGTIKITPKEVVPISTQESFSLPIIDDQSVHVKKPEYQKADTQ